MSILFLICIAILIFYAVLMYRQLKVDRRWYAERYKKFLDHDERRLDEIRKLNAKNLELQSELEEEKRRSALVRQMNEKLRRAE